VGDFGRRRGAALRRREEEGCRGRTGPIRLADGSVVEVQLDKSFAVAGQEGDDDTTGEDSGADND
jgi:hypothetical protein